MNGIMPYSFGMPPQQPVSYNPLLPQLSPDNFSTLGGYGGGSQPQFGAGGYDFGQVKGGGGLFGGMLNSTDANGVTSQGWGAPALGAASGLLNAWMGMKQYGLAKDTLSEGKRQFQLNYDAQKTTTNTQLEDRQRARVASNSGAYQSVGDYMSANGIRG